MKRILIIKSYSPVEKDTRVTKLMKMLGEEYNLSYLGWDQNTSKSFSYSRKKNRDYEEVIMNTKRQLGHSAFLFPLWWVFSFIWLLVLRWDMVHIVNFPSAFPAVMASKLKRKPVVYDIEDTYIDQLHSEHVFLRRIGLRLEKNILPLVNAVILVDEMQVEEFEGIPNRKIVVIYDSPFPITEIIGQFTEDNYFKIFYAGALNKHRHLNLDILLEAIKDINGVKIIFAGEGNMANDLSILANKMPDKVVYLGWVPYEKILKLSHQADILCSLRDPNPLVQKFICGSKFLEAIMCGKPFLVNKGTSAAIKVARYGCGIVVDAHNVEELKNAIIGLLENKELRHQLGKNGKNACRQHYGWEIMKRRILHFYFELEKSV